MAIVRYTADQARRKGRINRKLFDSFTEADIARFAKEDGTDNEIDWVAEYKAGRVRLVVPVKSVRKKTGLSQAKFARAFQISEHTLRNWEQGRRVPEGPAQALLLAIYRNPKAVMKALQA